MSDTWVHAAGPVHAEAWSLGSDPQEGPFGSMLVFGGTEPEPLPGIIQSAVLDQIRRGKGGVLMIAHSAAQLAWVRAQLALLTAPGGRA